MRKPVRNYFVIFKVVFSLIFINGISDILGQTPMSLNMAIEKTLQNNYDIKISEYNTQIAKERNNWGYAGALPSISVGASQSNMRSSNSSFDRSTLKPSITLNWMLFNGFKVQINKNRYELLEQLTSGNGTLLVENTMHALILGYFSAVLEENRYKILQSNLQFSADRYANAQAKQEFGAGRTYDMLIAKNAWLTDKALVLNQQMVVDARLRNLLLIMGDKDSNLPQLADSLIVEYKPLSLGELSDQMLSENTTLKNQLLNLRLLDRNVLLEQSSRYPSLALSSSADYQLAPSSINSAAVVAQNDNVSNFYASLVLNYTVFDGQKISTNIQIAKIQKEIGLLSLESLQHELTNRLASLIDLYNVRNELVLLAIENEAASQLNLTMADEKYRSGAISSLEFREVQKNYLQAALNKVLSQYNLIESHVDLLRLSGGLLNNLAQ